MTRTSTSPTRPYLLSRWEAVNLCLLWFFVCSFVCFCFLGLCWQHMEIPRPEVKLEQQLSAYTTATRDPSRVCNLHHSSWQHWTLNPLSEARDRTHVLMDMSQIRQPLSHDRNSMCFFFFFFAFSGRTRSIWKFPGWGSNWSCSCWPTPQPQPHRIRVLSLTYTTAHGNAMPLTH